MDARRTVRRAAFAAAAMVALGGCAYFNTLYNAKQKYRDAEKATTAREAALAQQADQGQSGGASGSNPQTGEYEAVIEKCKNVIARYPDSRHVDDAMLLIARSLYRLERYEEAAAALDSLEIRYPKTNLLADARFLKGKSLEAAERYDVAASVLSGYVDQYRKHDNRPEALYLLCICQMEMDLSDNAVVTLHRLEKDHGRSNYRFRAQTDMARILAEKELYEQSLAVYRSLSESRIPENVRYDVWVGMARVQEEVGDYEGALETLAEVRKLKLTVEKEPVVLLLNARANAGAARTARAVTEYQGIAKRFARGKYGAEANFRLGELSEATDSLKAAQRYYQEVPKAYAGSEFADEAIRRSADIGRVLLIEQTTGDDSPEAVALRTFAMAEVQLFQFNNTEKAIPNYEKIVNEFGESEYAPKAVYALGYIHGVVLADSVRAREWYDVLRTRYPESQQAQLAYGFYKGASPPPPLSEMMRFSKASAPARPSGSPPGIQPPVPPPVNVLPDSLRDPEDLNRPAPSDSSG
jgi:TolA-binding protein